MTDPLKHIEDKKARQDMGGMGYDMYLGAREQGATWYEAFLIVVALYMGMFHAPEDPEGKDEDAKT